jgi:6-phosphogluconolactonase
MKQYLRIGCAWLVAMGGLVYFPCVTAGTISNDKSMRVYIGTYTSGKSEGIYVARFDPGTGRLGDPELAVKTVNPSFLALHPNRQVLYAVGETADFGGRKVGAVSAFRIDEATGKLVLLNQQPSGGAGPCHLAVDRSGKCLLTANYGSGSIASLPLLADGSIGEAASVIQHKGSSVHPQRQTGPHAHFITTDPGNRFALACDLGLDKVLVYRLGGEPSAPASLQPNDPPSVSVKPGSGPRHLVFHPNGRLVFLLNEMGGTLTEFEYDAAKGALKELRTLSTLPEDFTGNNTSAEVQVHPSGKFVYGSNRGHDSIAVFALDSETGELRLVERQPSGGKAPRFFGLDPSGNWLLAENQDSNNIVVFRVDTKTGRLTPTGQVLQLGAPVCAVFVAR